MMERFFPIDARAAIVSLALLGALAAGLLPVSDARAQADGPGGGNAIGTSPSDTEYEVGPTDVVQIQVAGRAELSGMVPVDPAGRIQAPLLGAITVAGRTPAELTEELTDRYQLLDPRVTEVLVSVVKYNSRTLNFIGAVGSPGTIGFRRLPDLWDALLAAGGASPEAELSRVQIVRRDPGVGEPRMIRVNLSRGIDGTAPESLPVLRAGDTIIVPELAAAATAPNGFRVFGAVDAPGSYSLSQASSLLDALAIAGGAAEGADLGTVRLTRRSPSGVMTYDIDVESYLMTANPPISFPLREGDTIHVPEKAGAFRRVGQVLGPLLSIASTIVIITQSN